MNIRSKSALAAVMLSGAADAMAQDGNPHRVLYMLIGGGIGFVLGFLAGLWWCKRHHRHGDEDHKPHDQ